MKYEITYKILTKDRRSYIVSHIPQYSTHYHLLTKVCALPGSYGLFVFETYNQAKDYIRHPGMKRRA